MIRIDEIGVTLAQRQRKMHIAFGQVIEDGVALGASATDRPCRGGRDDNQRQSR